MPAAQSLDRLVASGTGAAFVSGEGSGTILFLKERTLFAQAFDGARLAGDPIRVAEDVGGFGSHGWFSASSTGILVYRTGRNEGQSSELAWFDRSGKRVGQVGPRAAYSNTLQVSPDGRRVVAVRAEPSVSTVTRSPDGRTTLFTSGTRVWVAEVMRGIFGPLVTENASQSSPVISGDDRVAYTSTSTGAIGDLYLVAATGVGTPALIVKSSTMVHANDFSPDGRYLIYDDHTSQQRQDLLVLPLQPDAAGGHKPILSSRRRQTKPSRSSRPMADGSPTAVTNRGGAKSTCRGLPPTASRRQRLVSGRSPAPAATSRDGAPTAGSCITSRPIES